MKHCSLLFTAFLLFAVAFTSCEKPFAVGGPDDSTIAPDDESIEGKRLCRVAFRVARIEQIPFEIGRAASEAQPLSEVCSRISFALFKNGSKVKVVHQESDDADFGSIGISVPEGTYQVLAIAHNGAGAATITTPQEISFPKNKMTDTFYYYQDITVGADQTYNLELKRAVAMVRLITLDRIPDAVETMRLYYTGGSSTFNAVTGFGAKNSRQTEERTVTDDQRSGNAQFDVYTFPHSREDKLKMTITALSGAGDAITEHVLDEIPVTINTISQLRGSFFGDTPAANDNNITFYVTDQWRERNFTY